MVKKMKMNVGDLLLVLIMKNKFRVDFAKIVLFFIFQTKSLSVFMSSKISQVSKTKFCVFSTQTGRNLLSKSESVKIYWLSVKFHWFK